MNIAEILERPYHGLWIGGKYVPGSEDLSEPIVNPATGETVALVAQAHEADVAEAVAAAKQSFEVGEWRRMGPGDRAAVLRKLAGLIREHVETLAVLETKHTGKPIADSRDEVLACAGCFEYYAGLIPSFGGQTVTMGRGTGLTFREPVGVCGLIVPWNFPIVIAGWKVAPALAMGNSIVLKPAPATPLTALQLAELAAEAGVPAGVFNVIPGGDEAGAALTHHPDVRKISFTGSTQVGQEVMRVAAKGIRRVSLELGGKSASIVFADADLEKAAAQVFSVYGNAGQDCCARSRMLVERSVYKEFIERFVNNARQLQLGDPMEDATQIGSLISPEHRARVDGYVQKGKAEGALLCTGGKQPTGGVFDQGSFYEMTVFADATPGMTIVQEEIFGPVTAIMPFDTEEEAIQLANSTNYGLSGSLWTRDIARALRVARAVETGVLSVNTSSSVHQVLPFGGVKMSGIGRELGPVALEGYSEWKTVFIAAE